MLPSRVHWHWEHSLLQPRWEEQLLEASKAREIDAQGSRVWKSGGCITYRKVPQEVGGIPPAPGRDQAVASPGTLQVQGNMTIRGCCRPLVHSANICEAPSVCQTLSPDPEDTK